ncbi:nucleotidyltransferase family protein [Domibacillus epiphyticus]|uniref:Nucleotidyl transferase domain-containing protein n=1 Tax=Domibacillus epiphyticus TaxID=1714355 RepID=A0A1V2A9K0_9BACI|nr:nucleotidyltransferase family protein [Domibacillus epiphyticus]OMP67676.1 hypothetical protein BTO28_06965 [Domibacillus epiphyticus]
MIGVLLAGGRGKRLRPMTDHIPKPMVPLLNRPLLDYNLNVFKVNEIRRVIMTICYKKEMIKQYAGSGKESGMNIQYIEEITPLGTAGSLFASSDLLEETVAILSGDALTNVPLRDVYAFHRAKKARVTIVTAPSERPEQFGVCLADREGRLLSILEKPDEPRLLTNQVSTGIYLIESSLFSDYEFIGEVDFARDVFPLLLSNGEPVFVYETNAYWQDVGTMRQYSLAEKRLKRGIPGITVLKQFYPLSSSFSAPFFHEKIQHAALADSYSPILKKQAGIYDEKVLL